jgi:flagellar motility protein MotE (MotC chaperone)
MGTKTRRAARVLPAIVLLLIAVLPMRIGLVWESTAQLANAEEAAPAAPAHDPGAPAASEPETAAAAAEAPAAAEPAAHATAAADATATPSAEPFDPQTLTKADYEVLQQLAKRRAELDQREKDLADRAAMLEAVQQQVSVKVDQQQKLKSDLEKLSAAQQDAGDVKYRRLVKIYEAMKPDEAARILEKMEGAVLLEVVMRMSERRLAPILAQMDPMRAQAITVAMAARLDASPEVAALPEPQAEPAAAPESQPASQ